MINKRLRSLITVVSVILLWHLFSKYIHIGFPTPGSIFQVFCSALITKEPIMGRTLIEHMYMSLLRVVAGSILAFIFAIILGILFGCKKNLSDSFSIIIELLRPIPPLAWVPLSILLFGRYGPIFVVFIGSFFPSFTCTFEAVKNVKKEWIDFAKVARISNYQTITKIIIPASLPDILNGIRIGFGIGWMCIIAAEMISFSSVGIGYYVMVMYDVGKISHMLAGMLAIGIMGYLINKFLSIVAKKYSYAE